MNKPHIPERSEGSPTQPPNQGSGGQKIPNDGGPAFPTNADPFLTDAQGRTGPASMWGMQGDLGMSYRQWLIGHVLSSVYIGDARPEDAARYACEVADAVIERLRGRTPPSPSQKGHCDENQDR